MWPPHFVLTKYQSTIHPLYFSCAALDYAFARERRFKEVVEMWDGYIERNPNEGRAYMERSGAYHHLGHKKASARDINQACDLEVKRACQIAFQMGVRTKKK